MSEENNILKRFDHPEDKSSRGFDSTDVFDKIAFYGSQINFPKIDKEVAWNDFKSKHIHPEPKVISLNYTRFLRVAAILVLLLVPVWMLWFNPTTISTELAESTVVELPDRSRVNLNSESTISFNKRRWKDNRSLTLDGEAFFDVEKGSAFTVKTASGEVQVLGTEFNVVNREEYFEVKCFEGLVEVRTSEGTNQLEAGRGIRLIEGKINSLEVQPNGKPEWLNEISKFEALPLDLVLKELSRHYDVEIETTNINLNILYSGGFTHNNLENALKSICIPLNLNYEIRDKTIVLGEQNNE